MLCFEHLLAKALPALWPFGPPLVWCPDRGLRAVMGDILGDALWAAVCCEKVA